MMGYNDGVATVRSKYGRVVDNFIMDDIQCDGGEKFLFDCNYLSKDDCTEEEGAGVICT